MPAGPHNYGHYTDPTAATTIDHDSIMISDIVQIREDRLHAWLSLRLGRFIAQQQLQRSTTAVIFKQMISDIGKYGNSKHACAAAHRIWVASLVVPATIAYTWAQQHLGHRVITWPYTYTGEEKTFQSEKGIPWCNCKPGGRQNVLLLRNLLFKYGKSTNQASYRSLF